MTIATLEIYFQGLWHLAGTIRSDEPERGYRGHTLMDYEIEWVVNNLDEPLCRAAGLSCSYPLSFDYYEKSTWPAFLLDILPSGFGRDNWLRQLGINDGAAADWPLLLNGTVCPPGNIRIREAVEARDMNIQVPTAEGQVVPLNTHPGFELADVLNRQEHFLEYAVQNGAYTGNASDIQGAAPKFMLVKDLHGRWHAEGSLPDNQVAEHWLVKFPRGKRTARDRQLLRNEAAYMEVARNLGLKVYEQLVWQEDTLLIPRFDREATPGQPVQRLGMETLCSLANRAQFVSDGQGAISLDELCQALVSYASDPLMEVVEFIKRDVANVVLGNTDNHARNTAVLRLEDGTVTLTPLFDFAPMYLDPEGVSRVCRWQDDLEVAARPQWERVIARAGMWVNEAALRGALSDFAQHIEQLPEYMRVAGVDSEIIAYRQSAITQNYQQLIAL